MASYTPPTEQLPIFDNSVFTHTGGGVGLTEAQANLLYLRKTFPDTATALETFNGGLRTTTLTATGTTKVLGSQLFITDNEVSPTSTINMLPSGNNPSFGISSIDDGLTITTNPSPSIELTKVGRTLNIATTAPNTILNVGTGGRTTSGRIHHYSDADNCVAGSGVHLNNGATNLSNTNIHNGTNSIGQLNLASGSGSSTQITVGNTNTTTALRGITTINSTKTDTIATTSTGETASLYNNTTVGIINFGVGQTTGEMNIATLVNRSGPINIGTGGTATSIITVGNETTNNTTTYLKGTTFISSPIMDTISANSTTSIGYLFNNINGGSINIGNGQTSPFGSIAIGNSASRAGAISIATGSGSTSSITIGTETTTNTTTTIYGNTVITKPQINILAPTSAASNIYLYGALNVGSVLFCANQTSGTFEIGSSSARTGAVEIAKNTRGDVNIASSMSVVGTNNTTIGTASIGVLSLRGANVNINTTGTGAITLGNTTGTLTLNKPITPAYTYPSALTQIGYSNRQAIAYTNINYSGGDRTYVWLAVSEGIYSVAYNSNTTATTNYMYTYLAKSPVLPTFGGAFNSAGSTLYDESYLLNDTGVIGNVRMSATAVIPTTGATTYIVLVSNIFKSGAPNLAYGYSLVVTRIA
jgi:hypothetical protein